MELQCYTIEEKRKAMIDAGHLSYASLARKIGCTTSVVRRVIVSDTPIRMSRVETMITNEIGSFLRSNNEKNSN